MYPLISLVLLIVDFTLNAKYCFSKPHALRQKAQKIEKPMKEEDYELIKTTLSTYTRNHTISLPIRKVVMQLRSKMKFSCNIRDIAHIAKRNKSKPSLKN